MEVIKPIGFTWMFPASVDYVYDGDTIICHVLLHPNEGGDLHNIHVRVHGINCQELNTAEGKNAKAYAITLLPPGTQVMLAVTKRDKYGRFLAQIILANGSSFGDNMIVAGHAVAYLT